MKKIILFVLAIILVFMLCACNVSVEDENKTWDIKCDNLDEAKEVFDNFVKKTINKTNIKVVESVSQTSSEVEEVIYEIDGSKAKNTYQDWVEYAFTNNDEYFKALIENNEEIGEITKLDNREIYEVFYREYEFFGFYNFNTIEEPISVECTNKGESQTIDGKEASSGTLTINIYKSEEEKVSIAVEMKNGLVTNYHSILTQGNLTIERTMVFEYGNVHIDLPDMTNWTKD